MNIQLEDKDGLKSVILHIHSDEEEFLKEINKYIKELYEYIKTSIYSGMPLHRLDPGVVMVDLVGHLHNYYVSTTLLRESKGRVIGGIRLIDSSYLNENDEIHTIMLNIS